MTPSDLYQLDHPGDVICSITVDGVDVPIVNHYAVLHELKPERAANGDLWRRHRCVALRAVSADGRQFWADAIEGGVNEWKEL